MNISEKKGLLYLNISMRQKDKIVTKQKYLGRKVPKNIEEIKNAFYEEVALSDLIEKLNQLKRNFSNYWKSLPETMKKKYFLQLALEYTFNSNSIEGSTLTYEDTEQLIENNISPNKNFQDIIEAKIHFEKMLEYLQKQEKFTRKSILELHKKLFEQTKKDIAGKFRQYHVRVGEYICPDWQDVNTLIREYFVWLNKNKSHPIILAARAHYKFEKIHPFGDGNGRVGRLISSKILKNNNYPINIIKTKNKKSYYKALNRDENYFVKWFIKQYLKEFKSKLL